MNSEFRKGVTASLILLFTLGIFVSCKLITGITITVTNQSNGEITDLVIEFTGGNQSISKLPSLKSFTTKINPTGSSALHVEYVDPSGKKLSHKVDVYFEHNYSGRIDIALQADGNIKWNDSIRPR